MHKKPSAHKGILIHTDANSQGGGGYSGFQLTGMIEWSQTSRSKKILRASSKTQKKSLDQKLTPKKSHADLVALKSSRKGWCYNNSKTRLFILYSQNYAARALPILFNTPKNPYSNQATQKNTCQIFVPKKIPESKISNPSSPSLEIPSTPPGCKLSRIIIIFWAFLCVSNWDLAYFPQNLNFSHS